MQQLTPFYTVI